MILEGIRHVKTLHITIERRGMLISGVCIDNGPTLNVCHVMTLSRIDVDDSMIRPKGMMVREFDGTKTFSCREIDLKILVEPCEFEWFYVIVDISTVFNLLLGRPWIHFTGAIASSLY